jgi:hypothetical protein
MADDQTNDAPTVDMATPTEPPRPRGRGLLRFFVIVGVVGCAVLGVLLYQGHEREADLRGALSASEYERAEIQRGLDRTQTALEAAIAECDSLRYKLRQTELARDDATIALTAVRAEASECNDALENAVSIARSHRDTLDEIASAIRFGMIGVADIPSKGLVFSSGYDLESEYRKVVKEYNDLVSRFNAAVERSNDLGEIVNRIINIMR